MDDLSFTRVWNVNLFCLIPFVPDKCVPNVNTRCLLPWHITEGSSNASSSLTEEETLQGVIIGNCSGCDQMWENSGPQPSITMRITQLVRWQTRDGGEESNKRISPQADTRCVCSGQHFLYAQTLLVCNNLPVSLSGNNWVLEIVRHMVMTPGGQRAEWHPACAPRAAHRSNALTATRTRGTDLATACCHGELEKLRGQGVQGAADAATSSLSIFTRSSPDCYDLLTSVICVFFRFTRSLSHVIWKTWCFWNVMSEVKEEGLCRKKKMLVKWKAIICY